MAWWLTVYCRREVGGLEPSDLLAGIRDQDREAPAGVDYWTLAEDYGIEDTAVVDAALNELRVEATGKGIDCEVRYRAEDDARPVVLHVWDEPGRVAEELEEAMEGRDPPEGIVARLKETKAIVGIELGFSQLDDMGVVVAYEIARWLAQRGDGVVVDDDQSWQGVRDGGWVSV